MFSSSRWTILIVLVAVVTWGCTQKPSTEVTSEPPGPEPTEVAAADVTATEADFFLCGKCGQIKGTEVCCVEGAEICDKCGLVADSPGCCKIEKGTDVKLCTKCGQIAGSDVCCQEGAEKCEKCKLAKGSPGCCKIRT